MRATKISVVSDFKEFAVMGTNTRPLSAIVPSVIPAQQPHPLVPLSASDIQAEDQSLRPKKQRLYTSRGGARPPKQDEIELLKATQPQLCSLTSGKSR